MNIYHNIILNDKINDGIYNAKIEDTHEGIDKKGRLYFILLYKTSTGKYIKQYIKNLHKAKMMMALCKLPVANEYEFPECLINCTLNIKIEKNRVKKIYM